MMKKITSAEKKYLFFKKSMVLYKSPDFDIAFKWFDLNIELDRLIIILYVNNKLNTKVDCKIEYDFERDDFELMVKKKTGKSGYKRAGSIIN